MIKQHLEQLISQALKKLEENKELTVFPKLIQVDNTKDKNYGDYATNVALITAKANKKNPKEVAAKIAALIPIGNFVEKVNVAGPGFINFFLSPLVLNEVVKKILSSKDQYGFSTKGENQKILIEFVSSNPTGPLHVGHGRHAVFGDVMARLLNTVGFKPYKEYYVNDAGRQMDILALSVWLRYLILCGEEMHFPTNLYQGDYVIDIAKNIHQTFADQYCFSATDVFQGLPSPLEAEAYLDALIYRVKQLLALSYQTIFDYALNAILSDIKNDLSEFDVTFDNWFSEREITVNHFSKLLDDWRQQNYIYEEEGALWFRSTAFGDEKDRVLIRSNGQKTYFVNDVLYHLSKFERQFDKAIDIFGSDHHGYIPRMKAAMSASHIDPNRLVYVLMQFVTLYRHGQQVQMSTRGGHFVTLRALRQEVGNDAARFFYIMRKHEQHMDFDLELAKSKSNDNPVYYVQYAHARIVSVFKQLIDRHIEYNEENGLRHTVLLMENHERVLLHVLSCYPDVIEQAAMNHEPHQLTHYLRDLAMAFHAYYNATPFLVDEKNLRDARLSLIKATQYTLQNGFKILGISAPENM